MTARLSDAVGAHGAPEVLAAVATSALPPGEPPERWWRAVGVASPPTAALQRELALDAEAVPDALGVVHEAHRSQADRRALGAFYTPPTVASGLVALLGGASHPGAVVADLAVGAGSFLLAVARHRAALGEDPCSLVSECLFGVDLDPTALAVTRVALARWCLNTTGEARWIPERHLICGDGLVVDIADHLGRRPDVIVGNPPFLGQMRASTARSPRASRSGVSADQARGYADTAMLFLERAVQQVADGGRVCLILPESTLAARDAAAIRTDVDSACDLEGAWIGDGNIFDAQVRVWAPMLRRRTAGPDHPRRVALVARWRGESFAAEVPRQYTPGRGDWARVVTDLIGGPQWSAERLSVQGSTIADLATASAGFRRHFYALAEAASERADGRRRPLLCTVGVVDPARAMWGCRPVRFAGRDWDSPGVDLARLEDASPEILQWVRARLVPKVLVSSQGTVIEAAVDPHGVCVPSTPLISVVPEDPAHVWRVAAVLSSPHVSAWMFDRRAGSGLAARSMRVTARDLLAVPLPAGVSEWDLGAVAFREAQEAADEGDSLGWDARLDEMAQHMSAAYGFDVDDAVVAWWKERRPCWKDLA